MRELCFETDEPQNVENKLKYNEYFKVSDDDITLETDGTTVKVRFNNNAVAVADILSYTLGCVQVKDINVKDADIEEIIRRLYKEGVAENV